MAWALHGGARGQSIHFGSARSLQATAVLESTMPRSNAHATVVAGPWPAALPSAPLPRTPERRKPAPAPDVLEAMRASLTPAQRVTLEALEIFRWRLAFVRRPLFQAPIPVLFDADNTRHVVIEEDGSLDEHPRLQLRA